MEFTQNLNRLDQLPLGGRLLVRSKKDWRFAVICRKNEDRITISVASPKGGCYRLHRAFDAELGFDGTIPFLMIDAADAWRENFSAYDPRW